MPISPQNVAPPINEERLNTLYTGIDSTLQNSLRVSGAICEDGHEHFKAEMVSYHIPVMGVKLNDSEKDKFSRDYKNAGWKEAFVATDGTEPGRGPYTVVVLRCNPSVAPK